jgi:Zn-dependent protease/predicted transcriptional regulator
MRDGIRRTVIPHQRILPGRRPVLAQLHLEMKARLAYASAQRHNWKSKIRSSALGDRGSPTMFGKRITLFRLLGFDIQIDLSWLFIALLITWTLARDYFPYKFHDLTKVSYWVMGVGGALGLFLSIVLHELGHSIVARKYGIPIKSITLFIFGGVAEMEGEPDTPSSEFRMAVAGPIISILIAAICYPLYLSGRRLGWPVQLTGVLFYLSWINGLLAVFNLVPAFPLDGGRLLRSILWGRKHNLRQATSTAASIGAAFGMGLIFLGILSVFQGNLVAGIWWFLIGMFLRGASRMSYQQVEIRKALEGEPIRRFMQTEAIVVPPSISVEDLVHDYIYKYHHEMFPVQRDSQLLGCVTIKQVKGIPREEWRQHSVQELMTPRSSENTISPEADAVHVLSLMTRSGNSRLMVMDRDRLVGVVTLKDLLRFLSLKLDLEGR